MNHGSTIRWIRACRILLIFAIASFVSMAFVRISSHAYSFGWHKVLRYELCGPLRPDPVSLLGNFNSYESASVVLAKLRATGKIPRLTEFELNRKSSLTFLQLEVRDFVDRNVNGTLQLEFLGDRLMRCRFTPADIARYLASFVSEVGISLLPEEGAVGNLTAHRKTPVSGKVHCPVKDRCVVTYTDDRLVWEDSCSWSKTFR
jgi:hypothetical protein